MARRVKLARPGTKTKHGGYRNSSIGVAVRRQKHATRRGKAFEACTSFGKHHYVCETGSNPRVAIAKAMRKMARTVSKRSGALAGFNF
jgi:hypothetical protein